MNAEEQKSQGRVLLVTEDDAAITILVDINDGEDAGPIKLYKKRYDEASQGMVEDQEVFNNTLDLLSSKLHVSDENSLDLQDQGFVELDGAVDELDGKEIEVFFDGDRLSLFPIKSYPKFDNKNITSVIAKQLEQSYKKDEVLKGLPLTDNTMAHQFNVGFETEINGEVMKFKVSSVEKADDETFTVKTKYSNNIINDLEEQMREMRETAKSETPAKAEKLNAKADEVETSLARIIERQRSKKLAELSELFGMSAEEMLEGGYGVDLRITSVIKTSLDNKATGDKFYYMNAAVASEPEVKE